MVVSKKQLLSGHLLSLYFQNSTHHIAQNVCSSSNFVIVSVLGPWKGRHAISCELCYCGMLGCFGSSSLEYTRMHALLAALKYTLLVPNTKISC